jgi:hypothetical protein
MAVEFMRTTAASADIQHLRRIIRPEFDIH